MLVLQADLSLAAILVLLDRLKERAGLEAVGPSIVFDLKRRDIALDDPHRDAVDDLLLRLGLREHPAHVLPFHPHPRIELATANAVHIVQSLAGHARA